ncbi:hypothetical protein BDZ89DRAFT_1078593 [Hymenopellis radicata]|nr:hypothetical protein BDZ89DRAFT_1078593 [Hymenopellis radicata]
MPSESRTIALFGYGIDESGSYCCHLLSDPSKLSAVPRNAKLAAVDYNNDETKLSALLKENSVDVVVSTLTTAVTTTDVQVAVARSEGGRVKLFLPSEFGLPTAGHTGTPFSRPRMPLQRIRELLPTARICVNRILPEFLPGIVSNPAKPGEFVIAGNGDARFSLTSTSDIAGYVAHILTALPLSDLENSVLLIEGQSMSLNEAAALYNKKPTYISLESLEEPSLLSISALSMQAGQGPAEVVEARSGRSNALWPGHVWKQLKDVVPSLSQASPEWTYQASRFTVT